MTSEKGSGPKKASGSRRPGPTIDLKATEVSSEPLPGDAASEARHSSAATASGERHGPADRRGGSDAGMPPPETSGAGSDLRRRLRNIWAAGWTTFSHNPSLQIIAAASAAGVVFFGFGLVIAGWFVVQPPISPAQLNPAADDVAARIARLESRIETLLAAPRTQDASLIERLRGAEAAGQRAADAAGALQRRHDELAASLRDMRSRWDAAVTAIESAQKGAPVAADAVTRRDIDALASRMAALEDIQKRLDQALKASEAEIARHATSATDDRASRLAVVTSALLSAVERGAPFTAELAAAKALGAPANDLAALEPFAATGVPSASILSHELAGLVPALFKAAGRESPMDGGYLEKLRASAERLVRVRPVGETAGDRPMDIIARIEARANSSDIGGALAELSRLPAENRAPVESWIKTAQAREAALIAARRLSSGALAAIGKPNT